MIQRERELERERERERDAERESEREGETARERTRREREAKKIVKVGRKALFVGYKRFHICDDTVVANGHRNTSKRRRSI